MSLLVGIDEVGIGPLAGPVMAAAVLIEDGVVPGVRDSKKMKEERRYELEKEIRQKAQWVWVSRRGPEDVNAHGLHWCWRAVLYELGNAAHRNWPDAEILIDGPGTKEWRGNLPFAKFIPEGDDTVYQIAAASLVAKAARDREMIGMAALYPAYGFDRNKGYGTQEHLKALRSRGECPIHRNKAVKSAIEDRVTKAKRKWICRWDV